MAGLGKYPKPYSPKSTLAIIFNNGGRVELIGQQTNVGPYQSRGNIGLSSAQEGKYSTPNFKRGFSPTSTNLQVMLDKN